MKRILITGASRGIGRAIAQRLADGQTTLFLHGRDNESLAHTCRLVEEKEARAIPLLGDLRDPSQITEILEKIGDEPLDALINNAGVAFVKPLEALLLDDWQKTLSVNVTAPFLLTQKLAPKMKPGSSIVNILSVAAKTGFSNWSSYCMSKFALEGFSQSVRAELRPRGIRVINIYPAATATDIWNGVSGEWPREKMMAAEEVAAAVEFALKQPGNVLVENITLGSVSGDL